jgi:predicted PurR-regulated permease PerM
VLAVGVVIVAIAAVFWVVGAFFTAFANVFLPVAVAAVVALVAEPYYDWLRKRLRLPSPLAVLAVFASIAVPMFAFAWTFGGLLMEQIEGFFSSLPEFWARAVAFIQERAPRVIDFVERYELRDRLTAALEGGAGTLLHGLQSMGGGALVVGSGIFHGLGALLTWAMLPVYVAFFLMAEAGSIRKVDHLFPFLKPNTRKDVVYLFQQFVDIIVAFFRGQLIVAFLQGLLYALGFSLVGLRYGFALGLMLGFMNIIPYLGSIVGLAIALPLAYFQNGGGFGFAITVLVVFTVVQLIESYLLTPKVMGDRTGLHPMVIIVAVFFWGSALGGIAGMMLAIPLTAFLVVFWRLIRDRYMAEVV